MGTDENKQLIRRYYEEVVSTGEVEILDRFISPRYEEVHDGIRYEVGIEGAQSHIQGVRSTYPDLRLTVDRQIAEEEWVVSCITTMGTHKGCWMGIKPTGKLLTFTGVNVDRIVDGRIVEHGGAANMLIPLLQAGALKIVGPEDKTPTLEREPPNSMINSR